MSTSRRQLLCRTSALLALAASPTLRAATPTPAVGTPASEAQARPLPAAGTPLKLPDVPLLDGGTFHAAQADGQILVIYWWASTCPFCALQSPEMEKLWRQQRGRGLQMLTLSIDRTPAEAQAYLRKKGYTFPAAFVTPEVQRVLPKPRGLPVTLVRGRDGRVLQAERGQMFPEDVEMLAQWL